MGSHLADFTIALSPSGAPSGPSTPGYPGFDAPAGGCTLILQLAAQPAPAVSSCVYSCVTLMSLEQPAPAFDTGGVPSSPTAPLNVAISDGVAAYLIRCTTNDGAVLNGDPSQNVQDRIVVVRSTKTQLRKVIIAEREQYDSVAGAYSAIDEMVDAIEGLDGGAASDTLIMSSGLSIGIGAGGGPIGIRTIHPAVDFPGTTTAVLEATLAANYVSGQAVAWAQSTAYSLNDIRAANGTAWVCTTAGTSSSSGTGPSVEGTGVVDGSVIWRSAQATLVVILVTSSGSTVLATLSVGYQTGGALTGPGAGALTVTADLSSALIPLSAPAVLEVGVAGDPADVSTTYTQGLCGYCAVKFS